MIRFHGHRLRSRLGTTASVFALVAGASGWSGLARAEIEASPSHALLQPEHYTLLDDGAVVVALQNNDTLVLKADQYLLLEDGLLLVTDELAQLPMYSLLTTGNARTQLLSVVDQMTATEGGVAQASAAEVRAILDGTSPRVSTLDGFDTYELAQAAEVQQDDTSSVSPELPEMLTLTPGALLLLRVLLGPPQEAGLYATVLGPAVLPWNPGSDRVESSTLSDHVRFEPASNVDSVTISDLSGAKLSAPSPHAALSWTGAVSRSGVTGSGAYTTWQAKSGLVSVTGHTAHQSATATVELSVKGQLVLSDQDVAASTSVSITGVGANDYIGYTAANGDATSPLSGLGQGAGNSATLDLGSGANFLRVGNSAGADSGSFSYIGGRGPDTLEFDDDLANLGAATIDLSAGGRNKVRADTGVALGGTLNFTGGSGATDFNFDNDLAQGGTVVFDMSAGGDNAFETDYNAASAGGSLTYIGGSGNDTFDIEDDLAKSGTAHFDLSQGGNNVFTLADDVAETSGSFTYIGGDGSDKITLGNDVGIRSGSVEFDMSNGGNNSLSAQEDTAEFAGAFKYTGGRGRDTLSFTEDLGDGGAVEFLMQLGGVNTLTAGNSAAESGSLDYYDGADSDTLTFGDFLAYAGTATFDMSNGGSNTLAAGADAAEGNGSIEYTGGADTDVLTFTNDLANEGTAIFRMELGGNNSLSAANSAAEVGLIEYYGGSGSDDLTFGKNLAWAGTATFDMTNGGANTLVAGDSAAETWTGIVGAITYMGGTGTDSLTFGTNAASGGGVIDLRLGSDAAADRVVFQGSVDSSGTVTIQDFNPADDTVMLALPASTASVVLTTTAGDTRVTATSISFLITGVTASQLTKTLTSGGDVEIG